MFWYQEANANQNTAHCAIDTQNRSKTHRSPSLFAWITCPSFIPSNPIVFIKTALPNFALHVNNQNISLLTLKSNSHCNTASLWPPIYIF